MEHRTGRKWIDNKYEYEVTLNPNLVLTGTGQVVMSLDGIDTITDVHPILVTKAGVQCQPTYAPNDSFVTWLVNNNNLIFFLSSAFYEEIKLEYVTIKYTKS